MTANNIVSFPKSLLDNGLPKSVEEIEENVENLAKLHIHESVSALVPFFFDRLQLLGFPVDEDGYDQKHGALMMESIIAFLCVFYNIEHPLQKLALELLEEEEGYYYIPENSLINVYKDGILVESEVEKKEE